MTTRKTPRSSSLRSLLVGALVGGVIAASAVLVKRVVAGPSDDAVAPALEPWQKVLAVVGALVVMLLVIALHEAGHLLGGRLAGFRAMLFIVGPLRLERTADGWHARLNRELGAWGGMVSSIPEDDRDLRRRMLRLVAGGPVASLVGALAAALLWLATSDANGGRPPDLARHFANQALALFAIGSLGIGVVTLIPARTGGFATDGAQILKLARGGPEAERTLATLSLVGMSMAGRRPREWPAGLVERVAAPPAPDSATAPGDALARLMGLLLAYSHALDGGDAATARAHLTLLLSELDALPPGLRPLIHHEAAYQAALAGDAAAGRVHLEAAAATPSLATDAHTKPLAEAAVAWAEGDHQRAAALLDAARTLLPRTLDRGGAQLDSDRISALAARLVRG